LARFLKDQHPQAVLKPTERIHGGKRAAADAVREGFDVIVAAGGDGTVHEVVNGLSEVCGCWDRVRLGILPVGTMNVFARELGIPLRLEEAWKVILRGQVRDVDLPSVQYHSGTVVGCRRFVQLAGAGLDARATECVTWSLKRKLGWLAYLWTACRALAEHQSVIRIQGPELEAKGQLVLIGNGRFYGGSLTAFPTARNDDGLLDIVVLPKVTLRTILVLSAGMAWRTRRPIRGVQNLQARHFTLSSAQRVPLELDGEAVGELPATFSLAPRCLKVLAPPAPQ
jgi:YegS/Rv2252/BmrU family lipid kinase